MGVGKNFIDWLRGEIIRLIFYFVALIIACLISIALIVVFAKAGLLILVIAVLMTFGAIFAGVKVVTDRFVNNVLLKK